MTNAAQIAEHMEVVGSDGHHVGKVDHVLGQDIELAKQSKPVELKPEPAAKRDVDFLSSSINVENKTKLVYSCHPGSHHTTGCRTFYGQKGRF